MPATYKQKLYLVLRALGIQDVEELVEKESPYILQEVLKANDKTNLYGSSVTHCTWEPNHFQRFKG